MAEEHDKQVSAEQVKVLMYFLDATGKGKGSTHKIAYGILIKTIKPKHIPQKVDILNKKIRTSDLSKFKFKSRK